ncbi:TPA: copper-translocating P-type ATPase, partial [Enterococcus faecium]|nr:copper-translocating P-type ATPase [Enterococcus faecium]
MNGNDMEKKHEHKKEVVNKESTESHEKQMEMKHDHSQMDHSMHMGHNHGDIANSKQMDHSMHMDHEHGGMDHSMHMGNFKQKFWLSLILAIPIILFSPMMGMEFPFQVTFPGSDWLVLILATILFIYGGQPFLSGAKMELKQKSPAMMTLIAMGITVAYIYSVYSFIANLLNPHTHVMDFFWELATLIVIMLLGHWIEMNAVSNASNALQKLAELLPESVKRLTKDGKEETVSLKEV